MHKIYCSLFSLFLMAAIILTLISSLAWAVGEEFDDPLRYLYHKINPGMMHTEVAVILKARGYEIHEQDQRPRTDIRMPYFERAVPDVFSEDKFSDRNFVI
jgi:hypothetical protein